MSQVNEGKDFLNKIDDSVSGQPDLIGSGYL
jgi:hypothetical protein